jgi:hypothetical protein
VALGDVVCIDWDPADARLVFMKEAEGALVPMAAPVPEIAAQATSASSGLGREIPPAAAVAEPLAPVARPAGLPAAPAASSKRKGEQEK